MNIPTQAELLKQYPSIRYLTNREYGYFRRIMRDPQNAAVENIVEKALAKVTADREREKHVFTVETTATA